MSLDPKEFTAAEQWRDYLRRVVPATAHTTQVKETRRAFYAGFEAALRLAWEIGEEKISEDAGVGILQGLHEECALFVKEVVEGRA